MTRLLLLVVLFNLIFLRSIAQSVYRSEYYAGMPFWESPIVPFKGEYPLTREQAKNRINLQLDYDSQNRIVEVRVNHGSKLKLFEGFFGNLYINAPLTKVLYKDQQEIHQFYDIIGNRIAVLGEVFEKIYHKDKYGRNVSLDFRARDGKPAEDQFGNRKFEWTYNADGSVTEIRMDAKGNLTPLRGEFQFLRTRINYGPDGEVSTLQNINENGELVNTQSGAATLRYFYDGFGRFKRWEVYDKAGAPAIGPSGTAGEYNVFTGIELTEIVFFNMNGGPATHWSGSERWSFQYDQFGNRTLLTYQNAQGQPKTGNRGYAGIRYTWDAEGRVLQNQTYLDTDGKPLNIPELGVATLHYQHNAEGLLQEISYSDAEGNPVVRKDNRAIRIQYVYDKSGLLIKTLLIDNTGKEITS